MSTVKLNQIVALNAPKKAEFEKQITGAYHLLQKSEPFFGREGVYTPNKENGEELPPESSKIQLEVQQLLDDLKEPWVKMFDVVLTNDHGNCLAKAPIEIDGKVLVDNVPVSTLIFLEKQLINWSNVLNKIPCLPLSHTWKWNDDSGVFETPEQKSMRTNKEEVVLVLYPATTEHPAQTKTTIKDVNVGIWTRKLTSSAFPLTRVEELKRKLSVLREAVIKAREQANSLEIEQKEGGKEILNYLFG